MSVLSRPTVAEVDADTAALTRSRVLVVDDNPVVRMGLRSLLEAAGRSAVVGEAGDGEDAVALARARARTSPCSTSACRAGTASRWPPSCCSWRKVLMLTYTRRAEVVLAAVDAGAMGYLVHGSSRRTSSSRSSWRSRRAVLLSRRPPTALRALLGDPAAPRRAAAPGRGPQRARGRGHGAHRRGRSNAEIAAHCFLVGEDGEEPHQPHLRPARRPQPGRGGGPVAGRGLMRRARHGTDGPGDGPTDPPGGADRP